MSAPEAHLVPAARPDVGTSHSRAPRPAFVQRNGSDILRTLDEQTRALYANLRAEPRNHALIEALESAAPPPAVNARKLRVVLVPGIFYDDYPQTGADGAVLRQVAQRLGIPFDIIPLRGTEGLDAAADYIKEWLLRLPDDSQVLLFTLSKGSAEVRHALSGGDHSGDSTRNAAADAARTREAFRNVHTWVSISGSPFGSPQFEFVLSRWLSRTIFRTLFWFKRWNLAALRELLLYRPSAPFVLPAHLHFVQIAACPLQEHLRDRRSMRFRKRLALYGPNDGFSLLRDLAALPGSFYPVWGADHYLRGTADLPGHLTRLIAFLAHRSPTQSEHRAARAPAA